MTTQPAAKTSSKKADKDEPKANKKPEVPAATKVSAKVNKSAFVRNHPDLPAKQLVALAKKEGVGTLTEKYVYTIRSESKKKGGASKVGSSKASQGEWKAGLIHAVLTVGMDAVRRELEVIQGKMSKLLG